MIAPTVRRRDLIRLTGDQTLTLPGDVREEIFSWARRNNLMIGSREHPIMAVTIDPTGRESHMYVTEAEMDHASDYDSHVRRVLIVEPIPAHLAAYFTPVDDPGLVTHFHESQGGVYGGLPEHLEKRLLPEATA